MADEAIGHRCGYDDALRMHIHCGRFYYAKTRKEIVEDNTLGCWVFPFDPPRRVTAMSKYYAEERGITDDHEGESYQHFTCPWCGGDLPVVIVRVFDTEDGA